MLFVDISDLNEHIWPHMCHVFCVRKLQLKLLEFLPELIERRTQVPRICFIGGRPPHACQTQLNGFNVNILTLSLLKLNGNNKSREQTNLRRDAFIIIAFFRVTGSSARDCTMDDTREK